MLAFQVKETQPPVTSRQNALPLTDASEMAPSFKKINRRNADEEFRQSERASDAQPEPVADQSILTESAVALLGIVTELPGRYHPDGLAVSVGTERVGLAGWIADRIVGTDADIDEETAKLGIVDLIEQKLVVITEARRLEATLESASLWAKLKSKSFKTQ